MANICPWCNTDLDVEREVFGADKLFTGHTCRGEKQGEETITVPPYTKAVPPRIEGLTRAWEEKDNDRP